MYMGHACARLLARLDAAQTLWWSDQWQIYCLLD
jgi:hypothetical protein